MSYWCVIQTEARREPFVKMLLALNNFETFMPLIRVRHHMMRYRTAMLFPSYVFVKVENNFWYDILWTPRVIRVIRSGDRPAQLPIGMVENLQKRARGGFVTLPSKPAFRRGDQVRVLSGTFAGHLGLFDGMSSHDRQRILLDLLGQAVPVELPPGSVERLTQDVAVVRKVQ